MNDEGHSNNPTPEADSNALPDTPHQDAQPKGKISKDGEDGTEGDKKTTNILTRELHWVEGFQLVFSAMLTAVGIVGIVIYSRQLESMRGQQGIMEQTLQTVFTQTKAMQSANATAQQSLRADLALLKGNNAARLDFFPTAQADRGELVLQVENAGGRVNAIGVTFTYQIAIESLPSFAVIGQPTRRQAAPAAILPQGHFLEGTRIPIPDWKTIGPLVRTMKEAVKVTGTLSYGNGFGDAITENICRRYAFAVDDSGAGSSGFMECGEAKALILRIANGKK